MADDLQELLPDLQPNAQLHDEAHDPLGVWDLVRVAVVDQVERLADAGLCQRPRGKEVCDRTAVIC